MTLRLPRDIPPAPWADPRLQLVTEADYPPSPPFVVGDRLMAYEWAMVCAERHPYPSWLGVDEEQAVAAMERREAALKCRAFVPKKLFHRTFYRELKAEFEAKRIFPLEYAHCSDDPERPDLTRCVFGAAEMLAIAKRRGDYGPAIAEMLAAHEHPVGGQEVATPGGGAATDVLPSNDLGKRATRNLRHSGPHRQEWPVGESAEQAAN
jgi:hypothetical protein